MDRLAAMEAFVHVLEMGSFSAAARELRLGQPAISKTIAQLEERLGVKLLSRSTRKIAPTKAGERFYLRAKCAIEEADCADRAARCAGTNLFPQLRVSANPLFASEHVIPHLPAFFAEHPGMQMDIILDDHQIDHIADDIDLSLRMGELEHQHCHVRRISRARRLVIGTCTYFETNGIPNIPRDLIAHQCIIYPDDSSIWTFSKKKTQISVDVCGRLCLSAADGVRSAVMAGMGMTAAPEWVFSRELAAGSVQAVLTDWALSPIDLWAVFPSSRAAHPKALAFANFVEKQLACTYVTATT